MQPPFVAELTIQFTAYTHIIDGHIQTGQIIQPNAQLERLSLFLSRYSLMKNLLCTTKQLFFCITHTITQRIQRQSTAQMIDTLSGRQFRQPVSLA
jgi:hypothetical protein